MTDETSEEPDEIKERRSKLFYQIMEQTDLFNQDLAQATGKEYGFDEFGIAENRTSWFINDCLATTTVLFRQELLDMARKHFPWATSIDLEMTLNEEEFYQCFYMVLSPLPPLT